MLLVLGLRRNGLFMKTRRTLIHFCLLGLAFMALPVTLRAQFAYNIVNGNITITHYTGTGGVVTIPNVIHGLPVTSIGNGAFYSPSVTMVLIPDSVTTIGYQAFFGCKSLTNVTIGSNVKSIGDWAFAFCPSLRSVNCRGNAPRLGGGYIFNGSLGTVYYLPGTTGWGPKLGGRPTVLWNPEVPYTYTTNNGAITITRYTGSNDMVTIPSVINNYPVTRLGTNAFIGCLFITNISIPNSIISIEDYAFGNCFGLTNVIVPNSVRSIGNFSFFDCVNLKSVTLGSNVAVVGVGAFSECYEMKNILIPDSVTNIEDEAFWDCDNLTNVFVPAGVAHVGNGAFHDCFSLSAIPVDANNQEYSSLAGVLFDKSQKTLIQFPAGMAGDYLIPDSVTNIGAFAFSDSLLSSAIIPDGVQTIGGYAFWGCGGLTNVFISDSVISIGDGSFQDCPWLASVTVGSGVTSIGDYAFAFNVNLIGLYFMGNAVTNVGANTFKFDSSTTVYYLPGTTGWDTTFAGAPTAPWLP
jgi:hypothetical protein